LTLLIIKYVTLNLKSFVIFINSSFTGSSKDFSTFDHWTLSHYVLYCIMPEVFHLWRATGTAYELKCWALWALRYEKKKSKA